MEVNIDALKESVEKTHGGKARFLEAVPVSESFEGKKVWEGIVHVFEILGSPPKKCYAWSYQLEGSKKQRFFAVLQTPPINTPKDAVRAAIIHEYRTKQ